MSIHLGVGWGVHSLGCWLMSVHALGGRPRGVHSLGCWLGSGWGVSTHLGVGGEAQAYFLCGLKQKYLGGLVKTRGGPITKGGQSLGYPLIELFN